MKKLNKTTSVLFAMALAASFISGCGNPSKSESSTSATSSVSSKSVSESSTESSMESSKEESKEVSKESSKDTSKESSKTSSNETSKEVSKESSKETSKESSKTSSNETSKEVSKESSKETPKETSKTSSSTSQSTSNSSNYVFNNFSKEQIIRYGRLLEEFTRSYKGVEEIIPANSLVGIVDFNEENCAIYYNGFLIPLKIQFVEIFPEDYVPDFSDPNWIGLDK